MLVRVVGYVHLYSFFKLVSLPSLLATNHRSTLTEASQPKEATEKTPLLSPTCFFPTKLFVQRLQKANQLPTHSQKITNAVLARQAEVLAAAYRRAWGNPDPNSAVSSPLTENLAFSPH